MTYEESEKKMAEIIEKFSEGFETLLRKYGLEYYSQGLEEGVAIGKKRGFE
jgi:hypothetical protein